MTAGKVTSHAVLVFVEELLTVVSYILSFIFVLLKGVHAYFHILVQESKVQNFNQLEPRYGSFCQQVITECS